VLLLDTNVILRIGLDDGANPSGSRISPSSVALVEPEDDPADRFIVATAMAWGADLLTTDRTLLEWNGPLPTVDARP